MFKYYSLIFFLLSSCFFNKEIQVSKTIESKNLKIKEEAKISETEIPAFFNEREQLVLSLLEPSFDPYRGTSLLPEKCAQKKLPPIKNWDNSKEKGKMISLYSSSTQIFGQCIAGNELLKTQYLLLYCKKIKKLLSIKYFYSDQEAWLPDPVVNCP